MWTSATREKYNRHALRYQIDVTDQEWLVLEPLLPKQRPGDGAGVGRCARSSMRFSMSCGQDAPGRCCPRTFRPGARSIAGSQPGDGCVFERINHALVIVDRERVGREASPSAAIIDSQSVKTTEAGGLRGYDAGKKVNERKRHVVVDTDGRALLLEPHPASIQDRDGGPLLRASRALYPLIARVFADSGYNPRADRERHEYRRRNRAEDRWPGRLRRSAASMGS